jgi:signal peptidase I
MRNGTKAPQRRAKKGGAFEVVRTVVEALLIAVVFRTLLFQPFTIPSGSMEPTLLVGDYLFVSKYSYGYSRYSLPFAPPLFSGRIFSGVPERGDIVVFRNGPMDFIKRVIGLPGDRIQVTGGTLMINGTPVKREPVADFVGREPCGSSFPDSPPVHVKQWRETLPNGVSYNTLECGLTEGMPDNTGVYTVPPGRLFMMGDNRENSEDSRFAEVGYVPIENLIGRAQIIFFSIAGDRSAWEIWAWPQWGRWGRIFTLVR